MWEEGGEGEEGEGGEGHMRERGCMYHVQMPAYKCAYGTIQGEEYTCSGVHLSVM